MWFPNNFAVVSRTPILQNADRLLLLKYLRMRVSWFLVLNFWQILWKIPAEYQSCSLRVRTDNSLITFFSINQFCTRNLQSIWYEACSLFLPFSIASVKLKQICCLFYFFSLLAFLSFLSSPLDNWILVLIHSCVLLF